MKDNGGRLTSLDAFRGFKLAVRALLIFLIGFALRH